VNKRPRMADVARIAGVSPGTVSRALAGSPLVSQKTREAIDEAVRATGYVVNQTARNLRESRTRQILVALHVISNPFFAAVVSGIEEVAKENGYAVLLHNVTDYGEETSNRLAQIVMTGSVDGLILQTGHLPRSLAEMPLIEQRMVAMAVRLPDYGITSVGIDETAAAADATAVLTRLGHRRIAHIMGPAGINTTARREGYRAALRAAGLPVIEAMEKEGENTVESGIAAARELLAGESRPSGIFCANDEMAIGAIIACKEAGLAVPADISIVGFDDIEMAAYYDPPLTTVRQPRYAIGRAAMTELLKIMSGDMRDVGRQIVLHHMVMARKSTAPPRK